MSPADAFALLVKLTEPDHVSDFTDVLIQLAIAADDHESEPVRAVAEGKAGALLAELADAVAAEMAPREQVPA